MGPLVPIILQNLPTIVVGVEHLINYIRSVRAVAQQNDEWTEEQERQFVAGCLAHNIDPAYLPDMPLHQATPPAGTQAG